MAPRFPAPWTIRAASDERGVVAVYVALLLPVLIGLAAIAVDFTQWYLMQQRLQRAADAAALAAAPFLPNDVDGGKEAARRAGRENGIDLSDGDIIQLARPTQVEVTARGVVNNAFGGFFGHPQTELARSAVGEFNGPSPVGNPCNTLGNEPPASAPPASVKPSAPFESCSQATGKFWTTVLGPEQGKEQGDQYMTRRCNPSSVDNCGSQSPPNTDFDARGYYSIVKVGPKAVGKDITLQLYDPAWVMTGGGCTNLPDATDGMNPYAPDAEKRYARSRDSQFCAGDQDANSAGDGNGGSGRVDTSFALLKPNSSQNPTLSSHVTGTDGSACIKQFRGYEDAPSKSSLTEGTSEYNRDLASVLNQWVTLCTFRPTEATDYYLQFRTNVPLPSSGASSNTNDLDPGIYTGNTQVYLQAGDSDQEGRGNNNFSMRAFVGGAGSTQTAGDVQISGYQRFPMFQNVSDKNLTTPPRFNLIRVPPAAAGQTITFTYFDVAEGSSTNSYVKILPPLDVKGSLATSSTARDCVTDGPVNGDVSNCTIPISSAANNGKLQKVQVPVPSDYDCNWESRGGCWFRLEVSFGPGREVNDTTTWTAVLDGDPVRLEE